MIRPAFTPKQRLKCFEDHGAIVLCQGEDCDSAIYIKGCPIDHWLALIDGGKHEDANFRPLCLPCHKIKSANEHKRNSKAKRLAQNHSGEAKPRRKEWPPRPLRGRSSWPESRPMQSRPFPKKIEAAE